MSASAGLPLQRVPEHVNANGNFVLDGDSKERGRLDLEIRKGRRNGARDVVRGTFNNLVEGHMGVVRGIAGELDFEIAVERGRCKAGLWQPEPDADNAELRPAGDLKHVDVAIAVAGVEGLDGYGEQEITLPQMADALSLRTMAHTIDLMQWMRHVISEGGLIQDPRAVCLGERRQREKHEDEKTLIFHSSPELDMNRPGDGDDRGDVTPGRGPRYCGMGRGNAVDLFATVRLIEGHRTEYRSEDHSGGVDVDEVLVQLDAAARRLVGDLRSADGVEGGCRIHADGNATEGDMNVA
jgi:hypothetical protein